MVSGSDTFLVASCSMVIVEGFSVVVEVSLAERAKTSRRAATTRVEEATKEEEDDFIAIDCIVAEWWWDGRREGRERERIYSD